jgi:hypothetical protein
MYKFDYNPISVPQAMYIGWNYFRLINGPLQASFSPLQINILQEQAEWVTNTVKYIKGART